ncbi:MAG: SPFH domain-containing protein [Planctomycetia bacterium]|nr:SPFH domain-containing protein [Planctomycetia bacterium]
MSVNSLKLENHYIASSQDISDLNGFFWTNVEVLPSTKVIVYENGKNLGELAPGVYTLETFRDHFRFFTTKSIKINLLRNQDFEISYQSPTFLCKEGLALDGEIRVRFALENGNLFLNNLMGSRTEYKVDDFASDTQAIALSALQEALCQFSIKELNLPETRKYLETAVENATKDALSRYGIEFRSLTITYLKHEKYDKIRDEKNAVWLAGEQLEAQKAQDKVDLDKYLAEITKTEEKNNLDILAKQVQTDREEGELAVQTRRFALKQELREQVQADKFNEIKTEEEMKQFLLQTDKAELLRDEEREELTAVIRSRLTDSDLRREAVLEKLNMQLEQEKKLIAQAYLHECKMKAVDQEIELARKVATQENEAWLRRLEETRMKNQLVALQRENEEAERASMMAQLDAMQKRNYELDQHDMEMYKLKTQIDSQAKIAEMTASQQVEALRLQARLEEQEKAKAETQAIFEKFIEAQERNADRLVQMHTQMPINGMMGVSPMYYPQNVGGLAPVQSGALHCPHCKSVINVTSKFCPNCGKQL